MIFKKIAVVFVGFVDKILVTLVIGAAWRKAQCRAYYICGGEFFFETFAVYLIVLKESPTVVAFENVVGGACRALDRGCVAIDGFYGCVGTAGRNAA